MAISSSSDNKKIAQQSPADVDQADDMTLVDPPNEGFKGGMLRRDAVDASESESLVDYLWRHRED